MYSQLIQTVHGPLIRGNKLVQCELGFSTFLECPFAHNNECPVRARLTDKQPYNEIYLYVNLFSKMANV